MSGVAAVADTLPNDRVIFSLLHRSDDGKFAESLARKIQRFSLCHAVFSQAAAGFCVATCQVSASGENGVSAIANALPNDFSTLPFISLPDYGEIIKPHPR